MAKGAVPLIVWIVIAVAAVSIAVSIEAVNLRIDLAKAILGEQQNSTEEENPNQTLVTPVQAPPTSSLAPPTNLSVSINPEGRIQLEWAGTDEAEGYNIYRSDSGGEFSYLTFVSVLDPLGTVYKDYSVLPGTNYSYMVTVAKGDLESNFSNPVSIISESAQPVSDQPVEEDSGNTTNPLPNNPATDEPPAVSVSYLPATPNSSQNITFTADASDDKGLKTMDIYVDDFLVKSCLPTGTSDSCSATMGPYGTGTMHTVYSIVTDSTDQTTQSSTASLTIA